MTAHAFQQEQTGELVVKLEGDKVEDLFTEAARALAELVGKPTNDPPGPWMHETVESVDQSALLVAWLNELIARTEVDHLIYTEVEIDELTETQVRARIRGTPIAEKATTVVSATIHHMKADLDPRGGVSATIVLEVQR